MSLQISLSQGTIIGGHYVVGSLLNSGGFGAVYRGIDTSEGNRSCAIKETYDVTPAARRQALMEASVLLTVRNQHLPEVYDVFEFNSRFYLVMQLIEGQDLLQLLKARVPGQNVGEAEPNQQTCGPCSEQEILEWLLPIADVLQELHSRNPPILHRDIKPSNLILTPQGTVVLVDFGLTKLYEPTRNTRGMAKAVSAGFSPLEQYLGKTSPQSDIYSMAATMYLLLTNRLLSAAVTRSMADDLVAPHLLNPSISLKLERALLQALAIHADQRYQSMGEFAQALRAPVFTAHGEPTVAIAPPIIQNVQAQVAPTIIASQPTPAPLPSYTPVPTVNPALPISSPYAYTGVQPGPASFPQQPKPSKKKGFRPAQQQGPTPQPYNAAYPVLPLGSSPSSYGVPPQAQSMSRPHSPRQAQRLPSASGQGCLWGILLGITTALIVWGLKQDAGFYLALLIGFVGYLAAGFFTTRRGGNFFRGGTAGYWAGVTSLALFGATVGIFLVIDFFQQLRLTTGDDSPRRHIANAWNAVQQPAWPSLTILSDQPRFINFVAILVVTVVIAWFLGLVGGVLGSLQNSPDMVNRQRQIPHP
jgi:serine/threonine protein kinase